MEVPSCVCRLSNGTFFTSFSTRQQQASQNTAASDRPVPLQVPEHAIRYNGTDTGGIVPWKHRTRLSLLQPSLDARAKKVFLLKKKADERLGLWRSFEVDDPVLVQVLRPGEVKWLLEVVKKRCLLPPTSFVCHKYKGLCLQTICGRALLKAPKLCLAAFIVGCQVQLQTLCRRSRPRGLPCQRWSFEALELRSRSHLMMLFRISQIPVSNQAPYRSRRIEPPHHRNSQ